MDVIVGAAFVPQTPLLVPEIAQGASPELADLTDACRAAVRRVGAGAARWIVVGAADAPGRFPAGSVGTFAGFGVPLEVALGVSRSAAPTLPAALAVGAWLLHDVLGSVEDVKDVEGIAVGPGGEGAGEPAGDEPCALLVVGDASACRTEKAPGYLDPRAEAFDAAVARYLAAGEPEALRRPLADGAADLLCAGAPVWAAAAGLLAGHRYDAELLHDSAPFGVGYLVAAWTARA